MDGVKAKADAVRVNTTLQKLHFRYTQIGEHGAKVAAEAVRVNTILRTVHLDSNNIGVDAGAKAMAEAVLLQELYLGKNKIGDALLKEIKTILRNKESSARKGGRS